jgi:drug/metabolite transporter (DMT)-like permease
MTSPLSRNSSLKTYAVLAMAILTQAVANTLLSKGMKQMASMGEWGWSNLPALVLRSLQNPTIWLGTILMIIFFLLFTAVLSWADLSFVVPAISAEVVVNVAFADYFLNEPVSPVRWVGTFLIALGVILVLRSAGQTVEASHGKEKMVRGGNG